MNEECLFTLCLFMMCMCVCAHMSTHMFWCHVKVKGQPQVLVFSLFGTQSLLLFSTLHAKLARLYQCRNSLSIVEINTMTKSNWGRKRLFDFHILITVRYERKPGTEGKIRTCQQEVKQSVWEALSASLFAMLCTICFLIKFRVLCKGGGTIQSGLSLFTSIISQENDQQPPLQANWVEALFSVDPSLCQWDKKAHQHSEL